VCVFVYENACVFVCGSPEYGRWVHADVIGVEVDRCVCLSMRMLACLCVAVLSTDAGCTWM
jgi:hypothetical protein